MRAAFCEDRLPADALVEGEGDEAFGAGSVLGADAKLPAASSLPAPNVSEKRTSAGTAVSDVRIEPTKPFSSASLVALPPRLPEGVDPIFYEHGILCE